MTSILEVNSDIFDFEGFTEEDSADNISVVPDSDPDSSDIEVSSVGSSDISDFGESEDENAENLNADAPNSTWTTNFGDVTVDPFEQDSGPNLPENFDVSVATPLNYFELLFKPEMFREIVTHTVKNNYSLLKRDETKAKKNYPHYVDNKWVNTLVDEMSFLWNECYNGHKQSVTAQAVLAQRLISGQCWYKMNNAIEEV